MTVANAVGLQGFQCFRLELSAQEDFIWGGVLDREWRLQAAERSLLTSLSVLEACPSRQQPQDLNLKGRSAAPLGSGHWESISL